MSNLSDEDKAFIKEEFKLDSTRENIDFLAEKFGASTRSIIAVLTAAGLYKRRGYLTKAGERPASKEELVMLIAAAIGKEPHLLEGLEKANKTVLRILLQATSPEQYAKLKPE